MEMKRNIMKKMENNDEMKEEIGRSKREENEKDG